MSRPAEQRFVDILQAIERCKRYAPLLRDETLGEMAYDAVLRNLAVIGEAVRSLPEGTRQEMPEVPWNAIAGLRNIVIHEYFRIKPELILGILENELDDLAETLRKKAHRQE